MALEEPDVLSLLPDSLNIVNPLADYDCLRGFLSRLVDTITAEGPPSADDDSLSASNYFQEAIMRYWSFISRYEKTNLRNKLLSHLWEENDQKIAQTLVITISKIACFDYPREWPELFSVLIEQLEKGDLRTSHRILEVLSHTIPTFPGKDLTPEISSYLFDYCWQLWKKDQLIVYHYLKFYNTIEKNTSMGQQKDLTFERCLLCLSIIQMLNVFDFRGDAKFKKVPPVKEVCPELIGAVESLVTFYSISAVHPKLNSVHRVCVNLLKFLVEIQEWNSTYLGDETVHDHIAKFCLDTITNSRDAKSPLFEQLLIKCMVILLSVLDCSHKPLMPDLPNDAEFIPILPDDRVKDLCKILITRCFLLTENDLKEWSQDPEKFYLETRPCHELDRIIKRRPLAEALFIRIFERYKRLLGPVVVTIFREATNFRPAKETDSDTEMFLREAAYTALAHVYFDLFDELPVEKLFREVFNPELQSNHRPDMCNHRPDMRIMHQKIVLIVDTWKYKVEGDMRKQVFCALLKLLEYDDLVVRVAACKTLQYLVEIDFQENKSNDPLPSYWRLCFKLLGDVQHIHSKLCVLDHILLGIIEIGRQIKTNSGITNIRRMILPFANQLMNEILKAWDVSIFETHIQLSVLKALCVLGELEILSPVNYMILRRTLITLSLDTSEVRFCFVDYGLKLWEFTISKALSSDSQFLELFPYLQEAMKTFYLDNLPCVIKIINGYIKLEGGRFLCEHASVLHKLLVCIDANLSFEPKNRKLKDTKTPVEEQEDEKNICVVDETKEKCESSSSSEVSMMRVLKMLIVDLRNLKVSIRSAGMKHLRKLKVSIRSAGMRPGLQSFSAAVEELGQTLLGLCSDTDIPTEHWEEMADINMPAERLKEIAASI